MTDRVRPWQLLMIGIACAVLGGVTGCQSTRTPQVVEPPYTVYRSPNLIYATPRRVLLMPVVSGKYDGGFGDHWYHLLAAELRSTKQFEVVTANGDAACVKQCLADAQRGLYAEQSLLDVRQAYRVDGVLFVRLDDFFPYWPPRMAVNANLVETTQGETIAALDGNWDARDDRIQLLTKDYAQHVVTANELGDPDLIAQSPEYFGKFVAHQIAIQLCQMSRPDPPPPVTPISTAVTMATGSDCTGPAGELIGPGGVPVDQYAPATHVTPGFELPAGQQVPTLMPTPGAVPVPVPVPGPTYPPALPYEELPVPLG